MIPIDAVVESINSTEAKVVKVITGDCIVLVVHDGVQGEVVEAVFKVVSDVQITFYRSTEEGVAPDCLYLGPTFMAIRLSPARTTQEWKQFGDYRLN